MRMTKRILSVLLIAMMAFMLSACEKEPAKDILGKWDMDVDFLRDMLKVTDDIMVSTLRKTGKNEVKGYLEFFEDGKMILDLSYPKKVEKTNPETKESYTDYEYVEIHTEHTYEFKDAKQASGEMVSRLYVDGATVNYRMTGKILALNGNSRTLVVSRAK